MQEILTLQAQEGMTLAKDVMTPEGRVLCGKGTVLTPSLLERFLKLDLTHVTVEGHPLSVPGEKSLAEELREIEERFSEVNNVAPLVYLKKRLMKRLVDSRGQ
ncbi:MAG: hypothetical protein M0T76_00350 [Desulfobacteraceae bacterium]|nr:hypothetical protein [Desulfobacteraceae bacterium]